MVVISIEEVMEIVGPKLVSISSLKNLFTQVHGPPPTTTALSKSRSTLDTYYEVCDEGCCAGV